MALNQMGDYSCVQSPFKVAHVCILFFRRGQPEFSSRGPARSGRQTWIDAVIGKDNLCQG